MTDDNSNRQQTVYVVLRRTDTGLWEELTEVPARNADHATIRAAREELEQDALDAGVELRAISARAWTSGYARLKAAHEIRFVVTSLS